MKKLVLNQGYTKGKNVHGEQRFAFDSSSYEFGGRLEAYRKRLDSVGKAWVSLYAPMEFDGALAALCVSEKKNLLCRKNNRRNGHSFMAFAHACPIFRAVGISL